MDENVCDGVEPSIPGKRKCMKCGKLFMSRDVQRIRRCDRCKKNEDSGGSPRTARVIDVRGAINQDNG